MDIVLDNLQIKLMVYSYEMVELDNVSSFHIVKRNLTYWRCSCCHELLAQELIGVFSGNMGPSFNQHLKNFKHVMKCHYPKSCLFGVFLSQRCVSSSFSGSCLILLYDHFFCCCPFSLMNAAYLWLLFFLLNIYISYDYFLKHHVSGYRTLCRTIYTSVPVRQGPTQTCFFRLYLTGLRRITHFEGNVCLVNLQKLGTRKKPLN